MKEGKGTQRLNPLIDVHVHLAALPEGKNGCHISPKMMRSPLFHFFVWKRKLDVTRPAAANADYISRLLTELEHSRTVKQVVLLGMDGVYDAAGKLDLAQTDFLISNRYVFEVAKRHPDRFLPGVSINPQRSDAIEELERCVAQGAALVKVLPNSQRFDPSDRRYLPFYRALAKHRIPLLSHVGYEFSLIGQDQTAGDPRRLQVALDEGVTIIAAHACSYGLVFPEPYFGVLQEFVRRYPNFFIDASALTLPNRVRTLFFLRRHPELHDRLLFGTDYPLPVFAYPTASRRYVQAFQEKNSFDRHALVLEALEIRCRDFATLTIMCRGIGKVP